jgi:hypothetical protein
MYYQSWVVSFFWKLLNGLSKIYCNNVEHHRKMFRRISFEETDNTCQLKIKIEQIAVIS